MASFLPAAHHAKVQYRQTGDGSAENVLLPGMQGPASSSQQDPRTHSQQPIVNGTSIIAVAFKGGIVMAGDTLGSYGSLARFRDIKRIKKIGNFSVLGYSGDYSDAQEIWKQLDDFDVWENCQEDGAKNNASEQFHYLASLQYARRSKNDPLWNQLVVGGLVNGEPFLGYSDLTGSTYQDKTIATGFGAYLATPLLRKAVEDNPNMTQAQAEKLIDDCLRVLFYRDARTINRVIRATVTPVGVSISEPYAVSTVWDWKFLHTSAQGH